MTTHSTEVFDGHPHALLTLEAREESALSRGLDHRSPPSATGPGARTLCPERAGDREHTASGESRLIGCTCHWGSREKSWERLAGCRQGVKR